MPDNTATTSPADELRKAARLMRERAYDVARHEDRWSYQDRADSVAYEGHVHCEGDPQRSGVADVILGSEAGPHIAGWHPAVALAVADLLDSLANLYEQRGMEPMPLPLAIARAYLGTSVGAVSRG